MSKLASFLSELSDHELKAFYHFRYKQFMKGSQEKIDAEMQTRGILPVDFEEIFRQARHFTYEPDPNVCPRCLSEKFHTAHEVEIISYSYATEELDVDYKTCLVCLYSQDKEESESGFVGPFGFIYKLINRKK